MYTSMKLSIRDLFLKEVLIKTFLCAIISIVVIFLIIFALWSYAPNLGWFEIFFKKWFKDLYISIWFFITTTVIFIFYPPVATNTNGLFLDGIAKSIENKHYSHLTHERGAGVLAGVIAGARLLGFTVVIFLIFTPLSWLFFSNTLLSTPLWIIISGYIIGREYFEIAALRIMDNDDAIYFRKSNLYLFWANGILCSCIFMIPIINLIGPIFCTILMVHEIQRILLKS